MTKRDSIAVLDDHGGRANIAKFERKIFAKLFPWLCKVCSSYSNKCYCQQKHSTNQYNLLKGIVNCSSKCYKVLVTIFLYINLKRKPKICKHRLQLFKYIYVLMVLLSIPFNKLPWYKLQSKAMKLQSHSTYLLSLG